MPFVGSITFDVTVSIEQVTEIFVVGFAAVDIVTGQVAGNCGSSTVLGGDIGVTIAQFGISGTGTIGQRLGVFAGRDGAGGSSLKRWWQLL